ncbi:MAG: hypothetical protein JRI68_14045 [Deltaproteobacteria bacterium]|nr:hypothetical protein [Deltaproteobacteria bacterium]
MSDPLGDCEPAPWVGDSVAEALAEAVVEPSSASGGDGFLLGSLRKWGLTTVFGT